jgi:hypothetical protein
VPTLALNVLGRGVRIDCADPAAWPLVQGAYGAMLGEPAPTALHYSVRRADGTMPHLVLERPPQEPIEAVDAGALLACLDAEIAVAIQRLRHDLYVVHSAVLEHRQRAVMLVASSGGGKSTLAWALLHHGFGYLSDELAPVALPTLDVLPYPRALMVKRAPPRSYAMTPHALRSSRGFHVPIGVMPAAAWTTAADLGAIFFVERSPGARRASVARVGAAEAAVRLYANALNPLAHRGDGLDAAVRIVRERPCFTLVSADLPGTCAAVAAALDGGR